MDLFNRSNPFNKEDSKSKAIIVNLRHQFIIFLILWLGILSASYFNNLYKENQYTQNIAIAEARISFGRDLVYRRFAAMHGGLYVPQTEKTPPNPYLDVPEKNIETPSGKKLTLMNPAYSIRQVFELSEVLSFETNNVMFKSHITSLKPINPINGPDSWERAALIGFEEGDLEKVEFINDDDKEYLRYMRPLLTEEGCLKCHAKQGYKVGDIRGGISIKVDMFRFRTIQHEAERNFALWHGLFFAFGLVIGFMFYLRTTKSIYTNFEAKEALASSEEHIKLLLNSIEEGIYGIDKTGNCTFCNPSCCKMLGYESENELLGKNMHELSHHSHRDNSVYPIKECVIYKDFIAGQNTHSDDEVFWRKDGSCFDVEYWSYPVKDDGEIVGAVISFLDITERRGSDEEKKQLEQQLFQSQKLDSIGRLAGGIAHDFNNILLSIMGYSEQLTYLHKEPDSVEHIAASTILRGAERAAGLTKQLLGFAREGKYNPVVLNINEIIRESVKVSENIFEKSVRCFFEFEEPVFKIEADKSQMEQVFTNLIINARDAMPKGGTLTFHTEMMSFEEDDLKNKPNLQPGNFIKVSVTDTGVGMPSEVIDRIYEPFFTTKREGEGTGLGLATVYGIINNHDGHISVHSEPDYGTTFNIYLKQSDNRITPHIPIQKTVKGTATILVVDDEDDVRYLMSDMLDSLGYKVYTAADGVFAVELFKEKKSDIDLVILDLIMPRKSGKETFKEMRQIKPDIKIVLSSGFSEDSKAADILKDGAIGFIQKPYKLIELSKIVSDAVQQ